MEIPKKMLKFLLKPVKKKSESAKDEVRKTPFDFWLQQNETFVSKNIDEKYSCDKCSEWKNRRIKNEKSELGQHEIKQKGIKNDLHEWKQSETRNTFFQHSSSYGDGVYIKNNTASLREKLSHIKLIENKFKYFDENFNEIVPDFVSIKSYGSSFEFSYESNFKQTLQYTENCSQTITDGVHDVTLEEFDFKIPPLPPPPPIKSRVSLEELNFKMPAPPIKTRVSDSNLKGKNSIINISVVEENTLNQYFERVFMYDLKTGTFTIHPRTTNKIKNHYVPKCLRKTNLVPGCISNNNPNCHPLNTNNNLTHTNVPFKFLCTSNMTEPDKKVPPEQIYDRVVDWLSTSDFQKSDTDTTKPAIPPLEVETNIIEGHSDITSITKRMENEDKLRLYNNIIVKPVVADTKSSEKTVAGTPDSSEPNLAAAFKSLENNNKMVKTLGKLTNYSPWQLYSDRVKAAANKVLAGGFPAILETEEPVRVPFVSYAHSLLFLLLSMAVIYHFQHTLLIIFCPY